MLVMPSMNARQLYKLVPYQRHQRVHISFRYKRKNNIVEPEINMDPLSNLVYLEGPK